MAEVEDVVLRLLAATLVGMAIGLNRDLKGKPTGMRTLSLVSLGAAVVCVSVVHLPGIQDNSDALSRVVQGIIQGVLTGVGFIGAGVVLRRPDRLAVHNLTTAATVWICAALGIACGLAAWNIVLVGLAITFALLIFGGPFERAVERWLGVAGDDGNG
ncbi:MgtC/SapB family protein [Chelatococcus reniformis]|uniref:Protein MgtC n=1 Tax=Chelatococcus reniformis TaxID=1494448 RepID=A0A916XAC5_9HYPH|nr:MgtC/SapB family protein [Chelatococcus reniformis]GGC55946.1 transport ATPase [Chelatococcus reniformis]